VLSVAVPPLRERRSDIAELALYFLEQARQRTPASPVRTIHPAALEALAQANWPGNVRELASAVECMVVFGRDEAITKESPSFPTEHCAPSREGAMCVSCSRRELWTLRDLNERHVAWVLAQTGGDKAKAAEILGVNLSTLYRWQRPKTDT
jgi:two-component system response regulator HydG